MQRFRVSEAEYKAIFRKEGGDMAGYPTVGNVICPGCADALVVEGQEVGSGVLKFTVIKHISCGYRNEKWADSAMKRAVARMGKIEKKRGAKE